MEMASIETRRGVTFSDVFTFYALDLTGYDVTAHCRSGTPDAPGPVVMTVSTGNGMLVLVPGTDSVLTRTIPAGDPLSPTSPVADMASLPPGDYWYELILTNPLVVPYVAEPCIGLWTHRLTGIAR